MASTSKLTIFLNKWLDCKRSTSFIMARTSNTLLAKIVSSEDAKILLSILIGTKRSNGRKIMHSNKNTSIFVLDVNIDGTQL